MNDIAAMGVGLAGVFVALGVLLLLIAGGRRR